MKYLRNVSTLEYKAENCTGCGRCIDVCPHDVFTLDNKKIKISSKDLCMECGACMMNCPHDALFVEKGVGCASAIINGAIRGTEPSCGCEGDSGCCC